MSLTKKSEKILAKSKKTLDKLKICAIILKCVIIVFLYGGFLPFFQEDVVKITKISDEKCTKQPNEV